MEVVRFFAAEVQPVKLIPTEFDAVKQTAQAILQGFFPLQAQPQEDQDQGAKHR